MNIEIINNILLDNSIEMDDFIVNDKGLIDVEGNVMFRDYNCEKLPFKFGNVTGDFLIGWCGLRTLKGSPNYVGGDFFCNDNNLTSLKNGPKYVGGNYNCANNRLKSLKYLPKKLSSLMCFCNKIKSLKHLPNEIIGDLFLHENRLKNLVGLSSKVGRLAIDTSLHSFYSGDKTHQTGEIILLNCQKNKRKRLNNIITKHYEHVNLIFKYHLFYEIWDQHNTFSCDNFMILIEDIEDGLL